MVGGLCTWYLKILDPVVLWSLWKGVLEIPGRPWSRLWVSKWYPPKQGHQNPVYFLQSCALHRPSTSFLDLVLLTGILCLSLSFLNGTTSPRALPPPRFYKKLLSLLSVFLNTSPSHTSYYHPPPSVLPCGLLKLMLHGPAFPCLPSPTPLHYAQSHHWHPFPHIRASLPSFSALFWKYSFSRKNFSGLRKNREFLRNGSKANIVKQVRAVHLHLGIKC